MLEPAAPHRHLMESFYRHTCTAAFAAILLALAAGCARVSALPAGTSPVEGWTERGVASWYGEPFHGRQTASGEVYDMEAMTAAHRTLPFGTRVRVDNLENGRSVTLAINDRGPFIRGRNIDVSRRAARELGMLESGLARIRLTVIALPGDSD